MIDRRVSAFLHGLARSQTGVHGGRPPAALIMFCCGTAWYMCVIAWLQRRFGLLALPGTSAKSYCPPASMAFLTSCACVTCCAV
jgi:hypothetical protein